MTVEQAFLKDVVTHPDDDFPRLVYADWLEEHGDPARAAFIRAQCRLRKLGPFDPERYDLEAAEADLLPKHEKRWKKPLAKITGQGEAWATFESKAPVVKAELCYTKDVGKWQPRKWESAEAAIDGQKVTAALPQGVKVWYLNLIDDRGLVVSTEHVESK